MDSQYIHSTHTPWFLRTAMTHHSAFERGNGFILIVQSKGQTEGQTENNYWLHKLRRTILTIIHKLERDKKY